MASAGDGMEHAVKHIFFVGNQNSAKSELIGRLLAEEKPELPVTGFQTVREPEDETGNRPIYIHPLGRPRRYETENRIGYCKDQKPICFPETFERFAPKLKAMPEDGLLIMDELGMMENGAPEFQSAVLEKLDRAAMVLAAVRDRDTRFLCAVRSHPRACCFFVPEGETEEVYQRACAFFKEQIISWRKEI